MITHIATAATDRVKCLRRDQQQHGADRKTGEGIHGWSATIRQGLFRPIGAGASICRIWLGVSSWEMLGRRIERHKNL